MKNIFKIAILLLSFSALAQNEADLPDGVGLPNATIVTTTTATDKVALFDLDNNSNRLILIDDLIQIKKLSNIECFVTPSEVIVLRQDITAGASSPNFFNSPAEAQSFNSVSTTPETEGKYSIMNDIEQYRKADGSFEFILDYIDRGQTANWTQTNNPLDTPADTTTGFNLISSTPAWGGNFQGMSYQNTTGVNAFYNGNVGGSWWFAIAAKSLYSAGGNTGTPAVTNTVSSLMELKVVNETGGEVKVFTFEDGTKYAFNTLNNLEVNITAGIPLNWIKCQESPAPFVNSFNYIIDHNETEDITINGSFFTPNTTVSIAGQTVNSVTFVSDNELIVNVTSLTISGLYDVVIDNGTPTTLTNSFEVKLFTTLIPGDGTTAWVRNTSALTTLGKLVPTTTASGWSKGASFGTVPANTDFTLEFNPVYMTGQTAGGYAMIGVDNADPNTNYNTMDYAIYLQNGSNLYVYENGASKGVFGSWAISDVLSVKRTGTTITYLKNDVIFYTSVTPSTSTIVFDSSLYRYLGAENIKIKY